MTIQWRLLTMPQRRSELFDYEGFLQEVEETRIKYGYSTGFLADATGLDESTIRYARQRNVCGFPAAAALSAILNVSIDKYVKAA